MLESARRALASALSPGVTGEDELSRVAGNLRVSLRAGVVGAGLGAVSNAIAGETRSAVAAAALCGLLLGGLELLRRGRTTAAALLTLSSLVVGVHVLQLLGYGTADRAALLYPVIILVAALALDRRLLLATTALCSLSVVIVLHFEHAGFTRVLQPGRAGWVPAVDSLIIFVVTAVAARRVVAEVVGGIGEARASERRLAEANRQLEARSAELERFTYMVSHDLKSPLVTIRGFLGYVERDARDGDTTRLETDLGRIRAATERMGRLLEDVLELSRTGRFARPQEDVPLLELVREARALVEGRLSERGVRVELEGPLPIVHGDRQQLVELLQNLLDNAAKFMGEQKDPRVFLSARAEAGREVLVRVRDNGAGIEAAQHQRIFAGFQRLDARQEGTGLGLALARRIVETHGGRIWVESEGRGLGSTFCFTLPAAGGRDLAASALSAASRLPPAAP